MAASATNTTTHFFREPRGLALVRGRLGARPRVWCAGCSTGDEPYSLVITALTAGITPEVVATDVNPVALARALAGDYPARNLRHVPAEVRTRWFAPRAHGSYQLHDEVRAHVAFLRRDLTRDEAPGRGFDAVFCRNVMVYFRRREAARAVATMAGALAPGGLLVIGASEWLPAEVRAAAPELALEELDGVMVYRRSAGQAEAVETPAAEPVETPAAEPAPVVVPAPLDPVGELRQAGDALLDAGAAREARARYQAALAREPLAADLHLRLALTHLHEAGAPAQLARLAAHDALRQCLFLAPELWPAWLLLAEVTEPVDPGGARLAIEHAARLLAGPAPIAPPAALAGFTGDARTARDAVSRWLAGRRRSGT